MQHRACIVILLSRWDMLGRGACVPGARLFRSRNLIGVFAWLLSSWRRRVFGDSCTEGEDGRSG